MSVGTIDESRQEAELLIVSMTTSTEWDLPTQLDLCGENRLDVAVSRGRCLAATIAGPALMTINRPTPEKMALVVTRAPHVVRYWAVWATGHRTIVDLLRALEQTAREQTGDRCVHTSCRDQPDC